MLVERIGWGASGEIFKVRNIKTAEIFVVKRLHSLKDELGAFIQENIKAIKVGLSDSPRRTSSTFSRRQSTRTS